METKTTTTATTMTTWEKKWMSTAPQDCMRTFVLNADAPGGYSEYGETMCDLHTFDTLTEANGKAKVSLLKQDEPAPLPYGTFIRMYLFGEINDGVPVWQYEANGEPKNFRNYFVTESNARWFERHPTGHVNRWKHDYSFEEVIACLKDYPIRSIKTFAEGAYTFGECLDIAFRLAFRPRSVGKYAYSIKPFTDLNEKNSKLVYSNCTLYDVVTDIGRIIDATPSMEIIYENGVYTFELRFIDRYGLEGEVHDISFFDMQLNDATNMDRDSSAGSCISFAENLVVGPIMYPRTEGYCPEDTNLAKDKDVFQLPYPIEEVEEIRFYYQYKFAEQPNGVDMVTIYDTGETLYPAVISPPGELKYHPPKILPELIYENPVVISKRDENSSQLFTPESEETSFDKWEENKVFLREWNEYITTPDIDNNLNPTRRNTIYYTRGDNKIYLGAIYGKAAKWYSFRWLFTTHWTTYYYGGIFTREPNDVPSYDGANKFYVAVKFKAMLNGAVRGSNSKPSNYTAFFNQQGQVIDIQSFGSAVTNYTKSMLGENRVVSHYYVNIGRKEMYEDMPRVGSSVIDKERGKRYVVTDLAFIRKMNGGLVTATLSESRAGKSRFLIAGNRQKCYAIPSNSIVDSMSHTHILCKMGVQRPFEGESSTAIQKPYLFNAFIGTPHGTETQPDKVDLTITASQPVDKQRVDVILSRMRLSALMSFRMETNSVVRIEDGEAVKYTDDNQQLQSIQFQYKAGENTVANFSQAIDKDAYEILNHTTQVSWVEHGNLQIGESLIDMSYFGDGDGLSEPLQLALLSSRMRLSDDLTKHYAARYDVTVTDENGVLTFTPIGMNIQPRHVGWALVRGNKVILLDNFDQVTDNVKVYYNIEVRD